MEETSRKPPTICRFSLERSAGRRWRRWRLEHSCLPTEKIEKCHWNQTPKTMTHLSKAQSDGCALVDSCLFCRGLGGSGLKPLFCHAGNTSHQWSNCVVVTTTRGRLGPLSFSVQFVDSEQCSVCRQGHPYVTGYECYKLASMWLFMQKKALSNSLKILYSFVRFFECVYLNVIQPRVIFVPFFSFL